ncbi:MAG: hypothetical protein ACREGD_01450 [Candidatus Saccharimonadales bacterium]
MRRGFEGFGYSGTLFSRRNTKYKEVLEWLELKQAAKPPPQLTRQNLAPTFTQKSVLRVVEKVAQAVSLQTASLLDLLAKRVGAFRAEPGSQFKTAF